MKVGSSYPLAQPLGCSRAVFPQLDQGDRHERPQHRQGACVATGRQERRHHRQARHGRLRSQRVQRADPGRFLPVLGLHGNPVVTARLRTATYFNVDFGRLGAGTLVLGCLVAVPALMANSA